MLSLVSGSWLIRFLLLVRARLCRNQRTGGVKLSQVYLRFEHRPGSGAVIVRGGPGFFFLNSVLSKRKVNLPAINLLSLSIRIELIT